MSYNVSKREAKLYGIERVKTSKASTKNKSSGSSGVDTGQLKALQSKYEKVLSPTSGETEAGTQLQNIITSKELGIAKAEQEPMAQGFVAGQGAALEKSAALKSLPLQTKLANLQSQRQAAADVLKAQLGFETENVNRQLTAIEAEKSRAFQEKQLERSLSCILQLNLLQVKQVVH